MLLAGGGKFVRRTQPFERILLMQNPGLIISTNIRVTMKTKKLKNKDKSKSKSFTPTQVGALIE